MTDIILGGEYSDTFHTLEVTSHPNSKTIFGELTADWSITTNQDNSIGSSFRSDFASADSVSAPAVDSDWSAGVATDYK